MPSPALLTKDALGAAVQTRSLFLRFENEINARLTELLQREAIKREVMANPVVQAVLNEFHGARVEIYGDAKCVIPAT